jgi:hypothetical protein
MFEKDQIWITIIVTLLLLCIPFGAAMAIWMDDPHWLVFCGTLLIFLS